MQIDKLRATFRKADKAWRAEADRVFGAGSAYLVITRYGQGVEGSELNRLWNERCVASDAYTNAMQYV